MRIEVFHGLRRRREGWNNRFLPSRWSTVSTWGGRRTTNFQLKFEELDLMKTDTFGYVRTATKRKAHKLDTVCWDWRVSPLEKAAFRKRHLFVDRVDIKGSLSDQKRTLEYLATTSTMARYSTRIKMQCNHFYQNFSDSGLNKARLQWEFCSMTLQFRVHPTN